MQSKRKNMVNFRVTDDELTELRKQAREAGETLSDYIRFVMVLNPRERSIHEKLDRVLEVLNAGA